jgi:GNAT superfamily N-acetyltransferase
MIVREIFNDREAVSRDILGMLPEWFGIQQAREAYIRFASTAPMLAAELDGRTIGYVSLAEHFGINCEIHSMGVDPRWHRKGAGRRLVDACAHRAKARGFRYLSVKTLSDKHPDPNYATTRSFYRAMGFIPFEELPTIWGAELPCLVLVRPLDD